MLETRLEKGGPPLSPPITSTSPNSYRRTRGRGREGQLARRIEA